MGESRLDYVCKLSFPKRGSCYLTVDSSNDVINHLAGIDDMAQQCQTMIPIQILADIDNSKNPMQLTKDRLERAATENQFMNGKIAALEVCISLSHLFSVVTSYLRFSVHPRICISHTGNTLIKHWPRVFQS